MDKATSAQELSRKLNLLMGTLYVSGERPATYNDIEGFLSERGVKLSRRRWQYMLRGDGPATANKRLLEGIAAFFEIDPSYLTGDGDAAVPSRIESQLQLVRQMRLKEIEDIASRYLGTWSPATAEKLTAFIKELSDEDLDR